MEQTLEEEMTAYTFDQRDEKIVIKVSHEKLVDNRSREEIISEAHGRVHSYLTSDPKSLLYTDRRKNLDSDILASIKKRENEIDETHVRMIENPSQKTRERWTYFQNRLRDLRKYNL
jgi:hypothetical protein